VELQTMLAGYGYALDITGRYDERTELAITAFQRHYRQLRVDGLADRSTIATLKRLIDSLAKG
jgi:N-acetylmuramoyl-L-alanine amidase